MRWQVESAIHAAQMVQMPKETIKELVALRKRLREEIQGAEEGLLEALEAEHWDEALVLAKLSVPPEP